MINYNINHLSNGLTVLNSHSDSGMVAVCLIYKVGSRDEDPTRTGFAHLFEHLMFRGTSAIPNFDTPVQLASGENNAYTTSDYTCYFITMPRENIETALWLESDRMEGLNISEEVLGVEKRVVIEEYNQRYLNQPYGDNSLINRDLCYKVHPYRWAPIGLSREQIAEATLDDVRSFYKRFYCPSNAILSIVGDITTEESLSLAEKWFGDLDNNNLTKPALPSEPPQTEPRELIIRGNVPTPMLTLSFHMGGRLDKDYYICDLISDILSGGSSSRLRHSLVKEQRLFSRVNAHISGELDPGLFTFNGQLMPGIEIEAAKQAVWRELELLQNEPISEYELEKVKNKFEANTLFGELNIMNIAINLGYYAMLGDISVINSEVATYRSITPDEIISTSRSIFKLSNSNTLLYLPENLQSKTL